jgi:hypothetical protein
VSSVSCGAPGRDRVVGDGGRIGVGAALDESDAGALRPQLELLHGSGPERVPRPEHDLEAELAAQVPRELPDRRRLPGAVDPGNEDHGRLGEQIDPVIACAGDLCQQFDQAV